MVCPDLTKEHTFHDNWPNIGAYRHDVEKTFGSCLKSECPCYRSAGADEYCTKYKPQPGGCN